MEKLNSRFYEKDEKGEIKTLNKEETDLIGLSEEHVENLLKDFAKILGIKYEKEKSEVSQEQKEIEGLSKWVKKVSKPTKKY